MKLYVSVDGDDIGRQVGMARLLDNVEEVRRVDQAIALGNEIWRSWALRSGGSVIEAGGDEVAIEVWADHIWELPKLAEQYAQAVGATISVGVGRKLSESSKALLIAKLRGKNQIVTWEPEMDKELEEAQKSAKDEKAKVTDEYLLTKASPAAPVQAAAPLAARPGAMQGDHEEVQEAVKTIESGQQGILQPEMTHAAEDAEGALHQLAQEQEDQDGNKVIAEDNQKDQLKQQLAQILTMVKLQLPVLQQLQQTAPEAFQAIISLVQGVQALGREVTAPRPPVKAQTNGSDDDSEESSEDTKKSELTKAIASIKPGQKIREQKGADSHGLGEVSSQIFDYSHLLHPEAQKRGFKLHVEHKHHQKYSEIYPPDEKINAALSLNGVRIGHVFGHVKKAGSSRWRDYKNNSLEPHSELDERFQGQGFGSTMYEAVYAHAKHVAGITHVAGGIHSEQAHHLHRRLAKKHGFEYHAEMEDDPDSDYPYGNYEYAIKNDEYIDLPEAHFMGSPVVFVRMPEVAKAGETPTGRHHLNLPVGSQKDNKVKVRHADGKTGWKQMSSGAIQGLEADAPLFGANSHPVSSRNPKSK